MRSLITTVVVSLLLALAGPAQAGILLYDVTQPRADGPPYPTEAITFDVFAHPPTPVQPPNPVHTLGVSIFDASHPPVPLTPLPLTLLGSDNGLRGQPGTLGMIDFALSHPPNPDFPALSFFDMIVAVMGVDPSPFLPGSPRLGAVSASSFDVFFDLRDDGLIASHMLHFKINGSGQPLAFGNVQVGPPQSPSFHLTFDLERTGGELLDSPLFSAQVQGTSAVVPEPSSAVVLLGLGTSALLGYGWRRRRVAA